MTMTKEMTLNQIMMVHPDTQAVFDKYGMDYIEGGFDTLDEAAMIVGLDVDLVFAALVQ